MAATGARRKTLSVVSLPVLLLTAMNCLAEDCGPTAYAYENRIVFFTCNKSGAPEVDVISLDDASPLRVVGRVRLASARSFDAASHYNNHLILLTWNHLDIYDLADPVHPSLVVNFQMKHQASSRGYERIEKTAENKFQVLSSLGAAELTVEGDTPQWTLKDIQVTPEMQRKMGGRPPESRFTVESDGPVPVRESAQFRYELFWKSKVRTGEVLHRQYLRKVEKSTKRVISELLLGERLETID